MLVAHQTDALAAFEGAVLVPTLGALHDGHLALARRARELGGPVIVSVFVNPTQFATADDLTGYPRTLDADVAAAASVGVDVVFAPERETVYPPGTDVPTPPLPDVARTPGLEDACRPGHFEGVAQVVARLFDLTRPAVAVFGEKDYQQLLVIEAMVAANADRWPSLRIERHATVRDPDGVAMSSRNASLDAGQRERARALSRALGEAAAAPTPAEAEAAMARVLTGHDVAVDYAVARDATTLEPVETFARPVRALIAARVDAVRLIDNVPLGVPLGAALE